MVICILGCCSKNLSCFLIFVMLFLFSFFLLKLNLNKVFFGCLVGVLVLFDVFIGFFRVRGVDFLGLFSVSIGLMLLVFIFIFVIRFVLEFLELFVWYLFIVRGFEFDIDIGEVGGVGVF